MSRLTFLLVVLASAASAHAAGDLAPLPERYRDAYVSVSAGIPEAGTRPLHIGDRLTFAVRVEFDPETVQLEAFDEAFFQRSFEAAAGLRLAGPPLIESERERGQARLSARWSFQVLGCPGGAETCRGVKRYELPMMSLSYQLRDETGRVQNSKSARFRPWPDQLVLAPAIGAAVSEDAKLTDYFPAGAWPAPEPLGEAAPTGWLAAAGGALMLLLALGAGALRLDPMPRPERRVALPQSRWQRLYATLSAGDLPDDRWADALRRCVTWYCQDELGTNPCAWLRNRSGSDDGQAEWRRLYLDVLELESVPPVERPGLLARIADLAGLAATGNREARS